MDIGRIEFPLKKRKNPVRCNEAAHALDGSERCRELEQFPRRAAGRRSELAHYLSSQLRKVRKSRPSLRDSRAAEKNNLVPVAGEQQIIRDRRAMGGESHAVDKARPIALVEIAKGLSTSF